MLGLRVGGVAEVDTVAGYLSTSDESAVVVALAGSVGSLVIVVAAPVPVPVSMSVVVMVTATLAGSVAGLLFSDRVAVAVSVVEQAGCSLRVVDSHALLVESSALEHSAMLVVAPVGIPAVTAVVIGAVVTTFGVVDVVAS
jgi:hypothetical protein